MKRIILFYTLATLTCTLSFVSCKKDMPKPGTTNQSVNLESELLAKLRNINSTLSTNLKNVNAKTTGNINYTNPLNPWDSAGFYHNQALDTLQAYLDITHDTTKSLTITIGGSNYTYSSYIDKTLAVISKYAYGNKAYFGSAGNLPESFPTLFNNLSTFYHGTYSGEIGSGLTLDSLYEGSNNFDSVGLAFCNKCVNAGCSGINDSINLLLVQALYSIELTNPTFNDVTTASAINCITQYEDSIISFNKTHPGVYTSASYQQELTMLSIWRYSLYYWYTVYNNPGSKWAYYYEGILYGTNNNNGLYRTSSYNWKGFWQGVCVNAADVGGGGMGLAIGVIGGPGTAFVASYLGGSICSGLMNACY